MTLDDLSSRITDRRDTARDRDRFFRRIGWNVIRVVTEGTTDRASTIGEIKKIIPISSIWNA